MVVAVEGDVEPTGLDRPLLELGDQARHPPRDRHAARPDSDQNDVLAAAVALHDLVGHPRERPADLVGGHQRAPAGHGRCLVHGVAPGSASGVRQKKTSATRRSLPTPLAFSTHVETTDASLPASQDRLKGGGLAIAARARTESSSPDCPEPTARHVNVRVDPELRTGGCAAVCTVCTMSHMYAAASVPLASRA